MGLLASPGIAALIIDQRRLRNSATRRLWVRTSLALGFACAVTAVSVAACAILFAPRGLFTPGLMIVYDPKPVAVFASVSLITSICCAVLGWRFERVGRAPRGG